MKLTSKRIIISLIIIIYPLIPNAGNDWKLVTDENDIVLYVREVSGHAEAQFKGVCTVGKPIEAVGSILSDIASYPKWFFKCIEAQKLPSENSSDLHFFLYVAIDTPWPFSDRDAVYETKITIDDFLGKVVVRSHAVKEPLIPLRHQYVRITDSEHQWILEKISPESTRITFINRTNAGGPFAGYISNPGIRDTTLYSLKNLKKIESSGSHLSAVSFKVKLYCLRNCGMLYR